VTKRILLPASVLLFLSGCAGNEAVVKKPAAPAASPTTASPAPTPAAPAAPRPGATSPAGPLRPEVPPAEEQRLLDSTQQNIVDVARTLGELEGRALKPPQQESLRTAKNFLDQARSALDQKDYQRAANLAGKARALTDDLAAATK
jgi:hypothetical protein